MQWAGRLLLGLFVFAACGDNKPVSNDASAVRDAHVDAPGDAINGSCVASDQCPDPAIPVCCLFLSPGGAGYGICSSTPSMNCEYVSCRTAGDPCHTSSGAAGTCTLQTFGPIQSPHLVCQ